MNFITASPQLFHGANNLPWSKQSHHSSSMEQTILAMGVPPDFVWSCCCCCLPLQEFKGIMNDYDVSS